MRKNITFTVKGLAPLILHNGELANTQNPIVKKMKAITDKRKKTDSDLEDIARLEYMGGLYVDDDGRVVMPGENVEIMLTAAARKKNKGKDFIAGIVSDGNWRIDYEGPKKADALYENKNFVFQKMVVIGKAKILRTRPIFKSWSLTFTVSYIESIVNREDIIEACNVASSIIGMGDWRPKYGRFEVVDVKE